jgi:hypothetical protein
VPVDDLARDASRATGWQAICKACDRERARKWYAANRDRKAQYYRDAKA